MQFHQTQYHRQRAQELRAIAYFIDDRKKQDTLLWLAHDYETMAEHCEAVGLTVLLRELHMIRIAERLRALGNLSMLVDRE